jgi:hypothetical protein
MSVATRASFLGRFHRLLVPSVFELAAPPVGGWHAWGNAFSYGGYTYVGYVDNTGDIGVAIVNELTGAFGYVVVDPDFLPDQHNVPALLRSPVDGRLLAVYCTHNGTAIFLRVSASSLDVDPTLAGGWLGPSANLDGQVGASYYTYPDLWELSDGVYLFHRGHFSTSSNWGYSVTTDGGDTWSARVNLVAGDLWYARSFRTSPTRLDFLVTDGSYAEQYADLLHFYLEGGVFRRTDGSAMAGSPPFPASEMTLVYDGALAGARGPGGLAKVGDEIACTTFVQTGTPTGHIGEDQDYLQARWDGSAWAVHTVAAAVGAVTFNYTEGGIAQDPVDLDHVVLSRRGIPDAGSPWRIWDGRTEDDGATWDLTQLTSAGDSDMYPVFPRDAAPAVQFVWQKGLFVDDDEWNTGIEAYGVMPVPPVPPGIPFDLTPAHHGGWSTPMYPKACYAAGKSYVGYVHGVTGGLYVAQYDHATHAVVTTLLDTPPVDDHNNPAVLVRSDGRILCAFSKHDGPAMYTMLSTNPGDISSFGAAVSTGQTTPFGITYPALFEMTGVEGSPIYLLDRNKAAGGVPGRLAMQKSTDGGATWSATTLVFTGAVGKRPYWGFAADGTKIHVMTTDCDPYAQEGPMKMGHMYFDAVTETWHKSDGTEITAAKPFLHTELTQVYSGGAFPMDGVVVAGLPRFTLVRDMGSSTVTGSLFRWDGATWGSVDVFTGSYLSADRYFCSLVMNRANLNEMFAALDVAGMPEIHRWVSSDGGATWGSPIAVTSGSSALNVSPIAVINGVASLPVVWLYGTYVGQSDFDMSLKALRRE